MGMLACSGSGSSGTINCHERRIDYEAGLCKRCLELLSSGFWKFTA